jgi:hypothetical protein
MELQTAFSYEENATKQPVMSRLPAPVILKERRYFVCIMETLLAKERVSQQAGAIRRLRRPLRL